MTLYERRNIGCDDGGGAGEPALGGVVNGATPTTLVEAVDGDAARDKVGKEDVVAVYVVVKAVDEEEGCFGGSFGLVWALLAHEGLRDVS